MIRNYEERRNCLAEKMEMPSVLLAFSGEEKICSLDIPFDFEVERNFFYLTGLDEPGCILAIFKTVQGVIPMLFVPRISRYDEVLNGETKTEAYYREKTGIQAVMYMESFEPQLRLQCLYTGIQTAYFCPDYQILTSEGCAEGKFAERLASSVPGIRIESMTREVKRMRQFKDRDEIEKIRKASELTAIGIEALVDGIRPGRYEYQLAADFVHAIKTNGARKEGFYTVVGSGANSQILHYKKKTDQLKDGDLVLIDLGADYEHYSSDVSRTYPVSGKFTEEQRYWYDICLQAQEMVISRMQPGNLFAESGIEATDFVAEKLVEAGLIECKEAIANMYHTNWAGIGGPNHQVGLNAHDDCNFVKTPEDTFQPGMVYAVEPGLYLKDLNIGIRIEDVVLVTENGPEILTGMIPKTADEIEKLMAKRK